jgi:hypothetical protein
MNPRKKSLMSHAARLNMTPDDAGEYKHITQSYCDRIRKVENAARSGDVHNADLLTNHFLKSGATKIVAVACEAKHDPASGSMPLAVLKARAGKLDPFLPVSEPVRVTLEEKGDGSLRPIVKFGRRRRELQMMCADALEARLPASSFNFLEEGHGGMTAAISRLIENLEGGSYDRVVTTDIKNCFGSLRQELILALLPLPAAVTQNVILIGNETQVTATDEVTELLQQYPQYDLNFPDTAARQGLPQGSCTSGVVMSRAVLGPLLNATSFADRLVQYGDDVAVPAKDEAEAKDILDVLRTCYESCPAGPLVIGRSKIQPISRTVYFCQYGLRRLPKFFGGHIHVTPSCKSYERFKLKVMAICQLGEIDTIEARVYDYLSRWPRAFPLWKPHQVALEWLEVWALEAMSLGKKMRIAAGVL